MKMLIIILILFLICYKIQRKICSQESLFKKKILIPVIWFIMSFVVIFSIFVVYKQSNKLVSFSDNNNNHSVITKTMESDNKNGYKIMQKSKEIASIVIYQSEISFFTMLQLFLLFNIPTFLFLLFIITGRTGHKKRFRGIVAKDRKKD